MKILEWSEHFATGHAQTDSRHKQIVTACNTMISYWKAGETGKCAKAFSDCIVVCQQHFDEENVLLASLTGRDVKVHVKDHRHIMDRMRALSLDCQKLCSGESCLSEIMHNVVSHILKHDLEIQQRYTP